MLTLIKREIRDHIVYLILAASLAVIFILVSFTIVSQFKSITRTRYSHGEFTVGIGVPAVTVVIIGICGLGAAQMYSDKTKKISAFLSTLAVSRGRILLARIITGILVILTLLVPLAIMAVILLHLYVPPVLIHPGMVFEIFVTVFLMAFACYCIGLQIGWNSNAVTPTLGALFLTGIFVPLIIVKGFGLQIMIILVLFIIASLIRTWHTFMTTSL